MEESVLLGTKPLADSICHFLGPEWRIFRMSQNTPLLFFKMAAEVEGNVKCSVTFFMEELQRYEFLNNKFSKDYKNKQVRDNCWLAMGKKFNMTAEEAEKKYKSIRSRYGRWLRKVKKIPSGSGRDAVPFAGDYANLGWLEQHIGHRTRSFNFNRADSDDLNESQSPETEDKEDEQDAESDFVEDQVDVIKVTIDNVGDLEKKNQ